MCFYVTPRSCLTHTSYCVGICHLMRYDHETDEEFHIMHAVEKDIKANYLKNNGSDIPLVPPLFHNESTSVLKKETC